jgi:hypothetical protein
MIAALALAAALHPQPDCLKPRPAIHHNAKHRPKVGPLCIPPVDTVWPVWHAPKEEIQPVPEVYEIPYYVPIYIPAPPETEVVVESDTEWLGGGTYTPKSPISIPPSSHSWPSTPPRVTPTPELDPGAALSACLLLFGLLAVLRGNRK